MPGSVTISEDDVSIGKHKGTKMPDGTYRTGTMRNLPGGGFMKRYEFTTGEGLLVRTSELTRRGNTTTVHECIPQKDGSTRHELWTYNHTAPSGKWIPFAGETYMTGGRNPATGDWYRTIRDHQAIEPPSDPTKWGPLLLGFTDDDLYATC